MTEPVQPGSQEEYTPYPSLTRNQKLSLAAVLSLAFLTFASTFTFGWVFDDPPQIPQNQHLRWSELAYLFTHHLWAATAGTEARFYRPLLSVWFLINKTLFGLNPHWFHVTTVLAHVAAAAAAFLVARAVLRHLGGALLAAATFGMHPLQAEAASWISAVNDPLAALLCFSSFLACRRARIVTRGSALWWCFSSLTFLLALLVKEVSVVLPFIVLADFWACSAEGQERTSGKNYARFVLSFGLAGAIWFALRARAVGTGVTAASNAVGWSTTLLTVPKLLLFDLYRFFVPRALSPHYDLRPVASSGAEFYLALALLALLAGALAVAVKRSPRIGTAVAWFIFPLLPTLNIRWLNQDDFAHDRYLYISVFGLATLSGAAYVSLRRKLPDARLLPAVCGVLVIGMAFAGAIQSQYWANDVYLFSHAVGVAPNNEWAHLNYGSALSTRGKFADAATQFVESYALKASWQAADYAGYSYQQVGDLSQAEHWFTVAAQENQDLANTWFGLAQIRLAQHRPEEAISLLTKALRLQPDADGYHYALGTALEEAARPAEALKEYETELRLHPYQRGAQEAIDRLQAQLSR